MSDVQQLSDGRSAGASLGQAASDLVSLHGATPVAQASAIASLTTTSGTTAVYGFNSTADFAALLTAVNSLITALKNKGITA